MITNFIFNIFFKIKNIFTIIPLLYNSITTQIAIKIFLTKNFILINFWKIYVILATILYYICIIIHILIIIKVIRYFPGLYFYPLPIPEYHSLPLTTEALGETWQRDLLPLLPENYVLEQGGILNRRFELGPEYGIEILLPGDDRIDYHLFSTELFRDVGLISYANIRRLPTSLEIGFYQNNPLYFRNKNYILDGFCFFHTYMSDNFPDKILKDKLERTYFIVDDYVILQFTAKYLNSGWKAYDLVMLFNNIDPTHYGMICRTPEIAQHVISQNNAMFDQGVAQCKEGLDICLSWVGTFAYITAWCIFMVYFNHYYPFPVPITW
jgi:hypothetical protein